MGVFREKTSKISEEKLNRNIIEEPRKYQIRGVGWLIAKKS